MNISQVFRLHPGDEIYWNDPDDGLCSDYYTISRIWIEDEGESIRIVDVEGRELECFAHEIN